MECGALLIPRVHLYVKCWSPDTSIAETFPAVVSNEAQGTVQIHFSYESCQLQDDNTWSWVPPPVGCFAWDTSERGILAPLRACAQSLHPDAREPRVLATRASSSPLGHSFTIPSLSHVSQSADIQAWSCNKAAKLLEYSIPSMLVYTDGSSSPQCHGSAVTLVPPTADPGILSCCSPYESSDESKGWAVRVALERLLQDPPPEGLLLNR